MKAIILAAFIVMSVSSAGICASSAVSLPVSCTIAPREGARIAITQDLGLKFSNDSNINEAAQVTQTALDSAGAVLEQKAFIVNKDGSVDLSGPKQKKLKRLIYTVSPL